MHSRASHGALLGAGFNGLSTHVGGTSGNSRHDKERQVGQGAAGQLRRRARLQLLHKQGAGAN